MGSNSESGAVPDAGRTGGNRNLTTLPPVVYGDSTRQIFGTALLSVLLTRKRASFPVYVQVEANCTTYLGGTSALPPGTPRSSAQTVFVAPEVFLGPFASPISDGTCLAGGGLVQMPPTTPFTSRPTR